VREDRYGPSVTTPSPGRPDEELLDAPALHSPRGAPAQVVLGQRVRGAHHVVPLARSWSTAPRKRRHSVAKSTGAPRPSAVIACTCAAEAGTELSKARDIVGVVANKKQWFQNVDKGKHLAEFFATREELKTGGGRGL
jgi:hypothetical protein